MWAEQEGSCRATAGLPRFKTEPTFKPPTPRELANFAGRERPHVRSYLAKKLGPHPDLDDWVQTVFVEFLSALPRFRGECSLRGFLIAIARTVAKRARQRSAWDRRRTEVETEPESPAPSPLARTITRQRVVQMTHVLRRLSVKKRSALILWAVDGKSPQAIADDSSASLPATRSRIYYARREVRERALRNPVLTEMLLEAA